MPLTDQLLRLSVRWAGYTRSSSPTSRTHPSTPFRQSVLPSLTAEALPPSSRTTWAGVGQLHGFSPSELRRQRPRPGGMNPNGGPLSLRGSQTPTSLFLGNQTADELTVVWLALTALLATWLLVLLFVNRFVRRRCPALGRCRAHRRGDYSSDIRCGHTTSLACWQAGQPMRTRSRATSSTSTPRYRALTRSPEP